MRYVDYWGTEVSAFDVHEPHERLIVASRAHWSKPSQPFPMTPTPIGRSCPMKTFATASTNTFTRHRTFRSTTPFREVAPIIADGRTPRETVEAVSAWVRESLAYETGRDRRLDERAVRPRARSWRLPGLRPCRARRCCGRPASRPGTRRATCTPMSTPPSTPPSPDRATPGSKRGRGPGNASTRPAAPRSANGTCSSRAVATTATSRRSKACTTDRPPVRARSRVTIRRVA